MITKGTKVSFKDRQDTLMKGVVKRVTIGGEIIINGDDGSRYTRTKEQVVVIGGTTDDIDGVDAIEPIDSVKQSIVSRNDKLRKQFNINQRFDYMAQLARMVINNTAVSLIITGQGGLGKTFTVMQEIARKKFTKPQDFIVIKGYSTARGLFRTLYENNGKLIVFDDCDEVLEDKVAKNILKSALDSYDTREVSWVIKTPDESLPESFEFTGRVIFISNKSQDHIEQAIISRSLNIDLTMTSEEIIERMEWIVANARGFMPTFTMQTKLDAIDILKTNLADIRELSLRSLEKVLKILSGDKDLLDVNDPDYKDLDMHELCRFMLLS
jgi:hypothetical protein